MIPIGERHLLGVLREYVDDYNESRAHLSLDGNAPEPRTVERDGDIIAEPPYWAAFTIDTAAQPE